MSKTNLAKKAANTATTTTPSTTRPVGMKSVLSNEAGASGGFTNKSNLFKTPTGNTVKMIKQDDVKEAKDDDKGEYYQYEKPEDQLILTEVELQEDHARILTAVNNQIPQNIVRYSYKERKFKPVPNIDQTFIHLQVVGHLIPKDTEEAKAYEKQQKIIEASRRKNYATDLIDEYIDDEGKTCFRILKNKFNFIDRAVQTMNNTSKEVSMQTEPPRKVNFSDYSNPYIMYQAYTEDTEKQIRNKERKTTRVHQERVQTAQLARRKRAPPAPENLEKKINDSNRMLLSVRLIERMLCQNFFDEIIQDFKYYDDEADIYKREGTLLPLWKFPSELANKMSITSVCWNPLYNDLFVISTGTWDFFKRETGLILFFSLKNPSFHETLIETGSGCMCLDFHKDYPWLLAAGFCDGTVCVFNMRHRFKRDENFMLKPVSGKHSDPVWQVQWQKNDVDSNLNFCSISSDGRVKVWTIKKISLVHEDIVILANHEDIIKYDNIDEVGFSDIFASGTCFDFNDKQEELFVVGTEEGMVFEFSKYYHNKILTTYQAHSMPVYAIKWNYYLKRIFITCSSDWTVKIWDHDYKEAVFTFDLNEIVSDVAWAPYSSTVFAAITSNGYVYFYDLSVDTYEPLCVQNVFNAHKKRRHLTHLAFNPHHPILLITDNKGTVYSFKISPNLRCEFKEDKKAHSIAILNKTSFEMSKIKRVIEQELSYENERAQTSRRRVNMEERKVVAKEKPIDDDDAKESKKNKRYTGA